MKYLLTLIILSYCYTLSFAQLGGDSTYDFLNLPGSARIGAIGGNNISIKDSTDLNTAFQNPALLHQQMDKALAFNYTPYLADINYGYVAFGKYFEKIGTFSLGVQYINYGQFDRTDEVGNIQGTFSGAEYAVGITYARQLSPRLSMGMTLKPVFSQLESYNSFGFATDFGISYYKAESNFAFAIALKNLGSQISSYNDTYEELPSDLQIGMTKKLKHAPFRFSLTLQDLLTWDLDYTVTDSENASSTTTEEDEISFGDNLFRHMIFGVEFLPAKNFHIDFGYNHRRRQELGYSERMSTAGFSWGFGFRVYKFHFSYGSARYHLSGTTNQFSITTNLSNFL